MRHCRVVEDLKEHFRVILAHALDDIIDQTFVFLLWMPGVAIVLSGFLIIASMQFVAVIH